MKLYFEWRTAVEMAVVLYGILIDDRWYFYGEK
nr:MAG TPA: hypothetical protein [Bacteriophage sp.]